MANEAQITVSLNIHKTSDDGSIVVMDYVSSPKNFQCDVEGISSATPGFQRIPTAGRDIDLSELSDPGLCIIYSLDDDENNFVDFGIKDDATGYFHPLGQVSPGVPALFCLSSNLGNEYRTGTGTIPGLDVLHFRARPNESKVFIGAFDR